MARLLRWERYAADASARLPRFDDDVRRSRSCTRTTGARSRRPRARSADSSSSTPRPPRPSRSSRLTSSSSTAAPTRRRATSSPARESSSATGSSRGADRPRLAGEAGGSPAGRDVARRLPRDGPLRRGRADRHRGRLQRRPPDGAVPREAFPRPLPAPVRRPVHAGRASRAARVTVPNRRRRANHRPSAVRQSSLARPIPARERLDGRGLDREDLEGLQRESLRPSRPQELQLAGAPFGPEASGLVRLGRETGELEAGGRVELDRLRPVGRVAQGEDSEPRAPRGPAVDLQPRRVAADPVGVDEDVGVPPRPAAAASRGGPSSRTSGATA